MRMNFNHVCAAIAASVATVSMAAAMPAAINPTPHFIGIDSAKVVSAKNFRLVGADEASPTATKKLRLLLDGKLGEEGIPIYIGERGDKAMRKFKREIPEQAEGYYLSVSPERIVIAGNDERGTFYAVQTLKQLASSDSLSVSLPTATVKDYPDVARRGIVEGFYGRPWSHEKRMGQMEFCGEYKMNTYIYGPKNDPYHSSPHWRQPYPADQAAQLKELIDKAHENEVDFTWAVHPGRDIRWDTNDKDSVIAKFEYMYDLGVRSFALFFDDISGKGTNGMKQAELLNYINSNFVVRKGDVKPLIICPTQYNRGRIKPETGYMNSLGENLDRSVDIMWTGDRVLSDITAENLGWASNLMLRPPFIWWNFPVSDYSNDRLLMGPVDGLEGGVQGGMSGFTSNPMEYCEASKIALYSVADYTWNTGAYDGQRSWERSVAAAVPTAARAMEVFCANSTTTGDAHYEKVESEYLRPLADSVLQMWCGDRAYDDVKAERMVRVFEEMEWAADMLLTDASNPSLIEEIRPWLLHFGLLGEMGEGTMAMAKAVSSGDKTRFVQQYGHVKALQQRVDRIRSTMRRTRIGSAVVVPFIDKMFAESVRRYNERYGTALSPEIKAKK